MLGHYCHTAMAIPLFDTATPLAPLRETILQRIAEVMASGQFVLGPEVAAFEEEFAAYLGARHVIGVANGTDAITIALRALGVKPGDDVVVPALTFYASAEAVVNAGARPVFCDVDFDTRNVTVDTVHAALTPRTAAILSVDLFGLPAPDLRELGLPVLEDAAQAAGARCDGAMAGTLGDVATFSFYPSKNLGAFGDGGAVVTDDDAIAELVRSLRFHGSRDKETFQYVGYNSRLDADASGHFARAVAAPRPVVRRPARRRRRVRGRGRRPARRTAGGARGNRPGVAPVRGHPSPRG